MEHSTKPDTIEESTIVELEKVSPQQNWQELLLSSNEISTPEDIEAITAIIEKAVENNNLEELQTFLETEAVKDEVPPQILFGLSLVYGRKGLVKEEYKTIEKLEEQVKQRPGIAFNLSLVYGRKETLKSQIDKVEADALALLQGFISISSEPTGAEVFLDGDLVGATPFTTEGLREGSYSIEIRKDNYATVNQAVSVKASLITEFTKELVLLPGSLVINSEPVGSTVLLDGEKIGVTPLEISKIKVGEYEITISKENYSTNAITAQIEPADVTIVNTSLVALTGILTINDLPDGSFVYLDGERTFPSNSTTMRRKVLKNIPVGKHELTIKKNNYIEKNIIVMINSGQITMISGKVEIDTYNGVIDTQINSKETAAIFIKRFSIKSDNKENDNSKSMALIRFDNLFGENLIPNGSDILSAKLTVYSDNDSDGTIYLHRMLIPWNSNATWNYFNNGISTDNKEALRSSDSSIISKGINKFLTFNVLKSLKAWASGEYNYGWLVKNPSDNGFSFLSSESINGKGPTLTIKYRLNEEKEIIFQQGINIE